MQHRDGATHPGERRVQRRLRDDPSDQLHRPLLEGARRLAARGVALDDAVRGVRRVAGDTGGGERPGVRPSRVAVVALQERGPVRHDLVQLRRGREAARERDVLPATAQHPRGVRDSGGMGCDRRLDRLDGREPEEVHAVQRLRARHEVDVGIIEPGRDEAAPGIDDRGRGTTMIAKSIVVATQPGDPPARNGDGRRRRHGTWPDVRPIRHEFTRRIGHEDPAVDEQQVRVVAHRSRNPVPSGSRSSSTKACSPVRKAWPSTSVTTAS